MTKFMSLQGCKVGLTHGNQQVWQHINKPKDRNHTQTQSMQKGLWQSSNPFKDKSQQDTRNRRNISQHNKDHIQDYKHYSKCRKTGSISSAIWKDTGVNFNILLNVICNVSGKRNQRDTTRKGKSQIIPVHIEHGSKFKRLRRPHQYL